MKHLVSVLLLSLLFSCSSDDDNTPSVPLGDYEEGFFILNEGPFSGGSGTVSYLDETQSNLENNVYSSVNDNESLGSILQSACIEEDQIYFIVNNAHRIVVANKYTLEKDTILTDNLLNPRYMETVSNKGFITNWGDPSDPNDDYIAILNLDTYTLEQTISVVEGPEKIVSHNNRLFVLHQGGWGQNDKVSVINTQTSQVESVITVGDIPNSFVEKDGMLYVLCGGIGPWPSEISEASLFQINMTTLETTEVSDFANLSAEMDHASNLTENDNQFYFVSQNMVYTIPMNANASDATIFVEGPVYKTYWADDTFFVLDSGDFNSEGSIRLYNETGSLLSTFTTGIIPTMVIEND